MFGVLSSPVNANNYNLEINTSILSGDIVLKIGSNNVLDNVGNGNTETTLNTGVSFNNVYTISYDANGGSGAPDSQLKIHGTALTLSSVKPTRSGYAFLGWSTNKNATSATYAAGGSYTANASTTLYAVWEKRLYLYNLGDECISVSGGWSFVKRVNTSYSPGSFTKGSNYLQLSVNGFQHVSVITKSMVSFKGYTKLNYVVTSANSTGSVSWTTAGPKTSRVAKSDYYVTRLGLNSPGVKTLDISSYSSGSYYVDMTLGNDNTSNSSIMLRVSSIYLS